VGGGPGTGEKEGLARMACRRGKGNVSIEGGGGGQDRKERISSTKKKKKRSRGEREEKIRKDCRDFGTSTADKNHVRKTNRNSNMVRRGKKRKRKKKKKKREKRSTARENEKPKKQCRIDFCEHEKDK